MNRGHYYLSLNIPSKYMCHDMIFKTLESSIIMAYEKIDEKYYYPFVVS